MKSLIASALLLFTGVGSLAGATDVISTVAPTVGTTADTIIQKEVEYAGDAEYASNEDNLAQDALQMGAMPPSESPRHRQEKAHLMKRMDRKTGKWGPTHPRYRLLEAMYGFTRYRERNMAELSRWRTLYGHVGKAQKKTLEKAVNYKKKLDDIEELIYVNEVICKAMVANALSFYNIPQKELDTHIKDAEKANRPADRISTSQTLKHFVRDWSTSGSKERTDAFPCLLALLTTFTPPSTTTPPKILLPGSGLGRLGSSIASLGNYSVTVNEYSAYMNIAFRYLNTLTPSTQQTIHPFIDTLSHHALTAHLTRPIPFPDTPPHPSVLLIEGDFTTAFTGQERTYDTLLTHFFIDTARNLLSYLDTIHALLKPGGAWINLGPLLYGSAPWVGLSLDEIVRVVEGMGMVFEEMTCGECGECGELLFPGEEDGLGRVRWVEAEYGFDGVALTRNAYKAIVWVVRKPGLAA